MQLHPQEALLQQARELQASPAFDEARRRRQVVEHRIARLVQLRIRQARYLGRTKTLFQLCLAAAVANLTLLAATSNALSVSGSEALGWSLVTLAALLSVSSLLSGFALATLAKRHGTHLDQLTLPTVPIIRSLTPLLGRASRPGPRRGLPARCPACHPRSSGRGPRYDQMQLGLFMMPLHPPDKPLSRTYEEDRELLVLADELGYSEAWIGEHATMAWENIPAPDQFIARVFPETKQIRFGTGVVLMAQHHPANTANRVAQLDHLTGGRINFGIGVGRVSTDLELFGIDGQLPELLMFRAIDLILTLWTEDPPYDMPGQFWPIRVRNPISDVGLGRPLKPFQKPHPPIAVPGMSAQSRLMRAAGERGWAPISSNLVHARIVKSHWDQVVAGAAQSGRTPARSTWRIAREIYVDETTAAARSYVKRGALARGYEDYFFKMFARNGQNALWKHSDDLPTSDLTLDYMIDNMWLVGDPKAVANQIRELYERVGGFGTLLWVTQDWDDAERWRRSMRLLAHEVMPRLADLC